MDVLWQNDQGFNPANAAVGPAAFDDHSCWCSLLASVRNTTQIRIMFPSCFIRLLRWRSRRSQSRGVPYIYMQYVTNCPLLQILKSLLNELDLPRVQNDTDLGNVPMVFGEWALSTNFNAVRHCWSSYTSLHMSHLLIF